MYQYRMTRLLRILNSDTITAELDLGFKIKTEATFRLGGVTEPELDLVSFEDPAVELRRNILNWFKSAPKPWTVQMSKQGDTYTGDILDKNGNLLRDSLAGGPPDNDPLPWNDETTLIPRATLDPGALS